MKNTTAYYQSKVKANDGTGEFATPNQKHKNWCKRCEGGWIAIDFAGHDAKTCPCCDGNWQDCPNCRKEGEDE